MQVINGECTIACTNKDGGVDMVPLLEGKVNQGLCYLKGEGNVLPLFELSQGDK